MMRSARTATEAGPPRPGEDKERDATVLGRLAALKRMPVTDLKAEWKILFGTDAPNNSRGFLERRLAHRIQELSYGGVARGTTKLLNALADEVRKQGRKTMISDPRNPVVGTRLVREWDGAEHTTIVLRDGFEFEGRKYKSLSAIARDITGTRWNGYRFFGLREAPRRNQ
jgi:type IV secretory pathway ATPase VirB11/archaellum biosynthesis ATPase